MPRQDTRRKLIEVASDLFLRRGYAATGVAEILARAGVGAGSFYYHFENKEELLLAVLDDCGRPFPWGPEAWEEGAGSGNPVARLFTLFAGYRRYLLEHDFELGCPLGGILLEVGNRLPAVRARTAELFEGWRGVILNLLEAAGERLPEELDRRGLAALVLAVMEGAVMQARAARSLEPFDAAVGQLRVYVAGLVGRRGGRPGSRRAGRAADREGGGQGEEERRPEESWRVW